MTDIKSFGSSILSNIVSSKNFKFNPKSERFINLCIIIFNRIFNTRYRSLQYKHRKKYTQRIIYFKLIQKYLAIISF